MGFIKVDDVPTRSIPSCTQKLVKRKDVLAWSIYFKFIYRIITVDMYSYKVTFVANTSYIYRLGFPQKLKKRF